MLQALRAAAILTSFLALTLPLMPVQWLLIKLPFPQAKRFARRLPHWYHRRVCRMIGIRIHTDGRLRPGEPVLIISNHVSWLDIPVLSAIGPVSFIAKKEVSGWPFVGSLARLQRTVFVDRERRLTVGDTASEVEARIMDGDYIILFAEGTSSDGNQVMPFRSALFASTGVGQSRAGAAMPRAGQPAQVQTLAIAYTRLHGVAMDRFCRPHVAWYGDMEMASHAWQLLKAGPLDVHIRISEPIALAAFDDRKALARYAETRVRGDMAELLRLTQRTPSEEIHNGSKK